MYTALFFILLTVAQSADIPGQPTVVLSNISGLDAFALIVAIIIAVLILVFMIFHISRLIHTYGCCSHCQKHDQW